MSSRKLSQSNRRQRHRSLKSRRRLSIESLEHRRLLATINWDGGPSGLGSLWSDPENWVGDTVPGAVDDVIIGAEFSSATIEITTPTTVNSILSHAPLDLIAGSLTVQSLTLQSTLTTNISSELIIGGGQVAGLGSIVNEGSITAHATSFLVGIENRGTLKTYNNVSITGALTTTPSSVITIPANDSVVANGLYVTENFTNHGLIELTSEASVNFQSALLVGGGSGLFTNAPTGTLRAMTGTNPGGRYLYASVVNQGTLQVQASLDITDSTYQTALVHIGTIVVESDAVLNIPNGIEINDLGTVSLATNASLNVSRLYGNLQTSPAFSGGGRIVVSSQIEVFSDDRGANQIGFTNNSSLGALEISGSVPLLDVSDNANGSLPESLYADTLILGLNSTLDLNGYKVYVRSFVDQGGAVLNGQIEVVPLLLSKTSILENQPVNSLIGRFSHFDASLSPEMQYELIGGDNSAFQIINGQLLANATFDYEARSQYSVLVRATAAGDSIVEQWFTIQIEDTNNAPVVGVSLKPWGLGANAGTVVAELVAFDHDFNDSHFFLFETGVGAADNGLFFIVGNQLVAASGFDFNGERAYSIRVQVTDSEGLSSVKDLSFTAGPSAEVEPDLSLDFASDSIPGFLSVGELIDSNGRFAIYQEWTNEGVIWHRVSGVEGESVSATGTGYVRPFGNALFVGDDLYFQSSVDTSSGYSDYIGQLWVWKASAATPELLATFENNFDFLGAASAGARLIFARIFNPPSSEDIGLELWSSDGTTFGTTKLANWAGGVPGNFQLVSAGEFAYFTGVENPEIWKTDGSVAGTFAVPGFSEVPWSLKGADDGTVLFSGYSSLWVSDGTDSGTNPLPGTAIGNGRQVVGINGDKVYFFARENGSSLKQLYARDRANSTTSFLGSFDGDAWIDDVISLGESLVFRAGTQVWITSGTQESTSQLFSRVTSNSPEDVLVSAENKFYFTARSVTNGSNRELWVSDGTVAGTSEVISQLGSVRPQYDLAVIDDRLIFTGSASNTGLAVFSISLVDINESPTDIALSSSSLAENSGVNAVLGSLSTSDPNAGDTFTYTLVSGDGSADNGAFNIDGDNLRANSEFDFEVASSYNIRVRSTDNGNLSFEKTFLITVTDVNEAPTITITNVASPLAENSNTANSIHVANISITDEDGGTNTLSLSDADAASFEIVGGNQLHLRSGVVLDFETKSTYVVTVQSDDTTIDGSPDATAIYTLNIGNVNERPTNVTLTPSSIPENAVANTVVGTLATIDPDAGDTFTYTLVSGVGSVDNAAFTILGTQLTANSSFDFEQKSSYLIRVESKDAGNLTFEKELTISVSNVNERPTDIALSVQSIAENRPVGTTVGTFSTTDPDTGDAFFYLLVLGEGSSGNSQFTIVGNQLRAAASFNFEVASSYNIRVRSTDNGNLGFEKTFLVTVTDVNESPTITITNVASPLAENSSTTNSILVANISLTDPDGGINTLSLSGADAASFEIIGGDQLHLRSGGVLDFETKSSYFVTVQSDDTTVPGTPDVTATYTLSISNVNEHPTGVQLSNRSVLENRPSGTLVGLLSAIDPDNSDTATFQLLPGQLDNADFQIHGNQLQSARTFDAEEKWSYEIRIRVMDAGGLSVDRDLLIDISGENEWPPVFTSPTSYSHPENITDVGLLNAPDPDKPVSNVVYTIVGGADQARFSLVGPLLRMVPSPNFEVPSSAAGTNTFEVIVRASDGLFNVDQTLTVNIANANDLPTLPVIDGNTIPENEPIGTVIGVFGSSDDDGDTVSYFLVSGYGSTDNSSFQIVGNQLRSTQSFNYEFLAHREMSIRVAATDGRGGIQQRTFTITTLDINEAPSGVEGNVSTDMNTATAITLQGFDPENAGLTFSLVQSPRFGSLSGAIPDLLYTPNPNFVGQDELFFTVSDGTLLSTETRVLISVIGPKPTISFSTDNVTVNEGVGIYSLTLNSSIALPYDLWVPFSVAATSTASELEDYSSILPFLGIRIPAGQTTGTTSIQILDDLMFEPGANESLVVDLVANPFSTIGTLSRFTLSIADNDVAPLVRFSSPGVSVLEGASQAVTVRLTGRSTQTVTVPFSIDSSSTAALGTDYNTLVPSSSLVFMPGEIAKTISIPLINDQNVELTETLRINLGTPINATLSTVNRSFSLTIIDDDQPTVSMSRLTRGVQETTGQVTVTAALSQATSNEIVVPYILGGTATSGVSGNVVVNRVEYRGIGRIEAGVGIDTLTGPAFANTWTIDGVNGGGLDFGSSPITFSGVENLTGSTNADQFVFQDLGRITGTINGGSGIDILDLSSRTDVLEVRLGAPSILTDIIGGYTAIEQVHGNDLELNKIVGTDAATSWSINAQGNVVVNRVEYRGIRRIEAGVGVDTLTGPAFANTWTIDGVNGGGLDFGSSPITFSGVENLTGSTNADQFVFQDFGRITGSINGGSGVDVLDFSARTDAMEVRLGTTSSVTNIAGAYSAIEQIRGNSLPLSRIIGTDSPTSWTMNTLGSILVSRSEFRGFRRVEAGSGLDTLTGPALSSVWTIDSLNGGTLDFGLSSLSFSGIENIGGNTLDDSFEILPTGSLLGNLSGGTGTGFDSISYGAWVDGVQIDLSRPSTTLGNATGILGHTSGFELVSGGAGNDSLIAQASVATILLGRAGHDLLRGGTGRDFLIGGEGADNLQGLGGEDLLISGATLHDSDRSALVAIRNEWTTSARNFATRVANLRGQGTGSSLNGSYLLNSESIFDDAETEDLLTGGTNQDWFWSELDEIVDLITSGNSPDRFR